MEFTPETAPGRKLIQAYGDGGFRIEGERIAGSVLVFPDRVVAWRAARFEDVTVESLSAALEAEPRLELLIVGCGARLAHPEPALRARLKAAGLVAEFMDTGAACRTFNLLVADARRVAAALIAVD